MVDCVASTEVDSVVSPDSGAAVDELPASSSVISSAEDTLSSFVSVLTSSDSAEMGESKTTSPSHSYTGQQRPGRTTLRQFWKNDALGSSAQVAGLQSSSPSVEFVRIDVPSSPAVAFDMIRSPMESDMISPSHSYTGQQRPGMTTLRQASKRAVLGSSGHFSGLHSVSSCVGGLTVSEVESTVLFERTRSPTSKPVPVELSGCPVDTSNTDSSVVESVILSVSG